MSFYADFRTFQFKFDVNLFMENGNGLWCPDEEFIFTYSFTSKPKLPALYSSGGKTECAA